MAATAYYQNREKAFNRTSRIHRDLNRASAYIFDSDANSLSAYSRPSGRSSSLTRDAPRYVDPSNAGYRFKDKLPTNDFHRRSIKIPIQTNIFPPLTLCIFLPRYKREQEMKDIHNDFMRSWKDQQDYGIDSICFGRQGFFTRQTIGDIFKDMSKFSTKTVAALSTLDTSGANKTKNYNWRKEIEKYESTGQLERDARIRNIEIRNKRHEDETDFKVRPIRTQRDESAPASLSRPETKVVRISTPEDYRKEKINHIVIAPKVKTEEQPAVASPVKKPTKGGLHQREPTCTDGKYTNNFVPCKETGKDPKEKVTKGRRKCQR
ncbi:unnamed protein product [Lepeophtheirus salmonis]|uniref:(salmon louse) hypothetical protein n=1 Tax=Lepeophtheirus salmonis TaxID=72036 RepID=A0A7R8CE89_LEPSM|nr:unnamed protein product [Lepeophtheirus salmonis]CAF2793160.1 unnamed protein product [Lepeophtheirus salmonis]